MSQKKLKKPPLKPRNPLVAAAMQRHAGSHRATRATLRLREKRALQQALRRSDWDDSTNSARVE